MSPVNGLLSSISLDDAVDLARAAVESDSRLWTRSNKIVAKKYNVTLAAYEIGQHLVGIGVDESNQQLTDLLISINRDPRMEDLYNNLIRAWSQEGGSLMCAFASTGSFSKFGSWGYKEYQLQPWDKAPKFRSLKKAAHRAQLLSR